MCSMVVSSLTEEGVDMLVVLPSGHHIRWAMEVLGHSFALPMDDSDVISGSLGVYQRWLGVDDEAKGGKDQRPACMQKVEQTFIQDVLGQMTLLFEERSSNGIPSGMAESNLATHVGLCTKVLETFDALVKHRGTQLSTPTWDRLIRLVLGAADGLLHNLRNQLGNHLCGQLVRLLFEVYLRSLPQCGPRGELWGLLQKFCRRWIHRTLVIEQWNAVTLGLTRSMMRQIHDQNATKEIEINWADNRQPFKFKLESPMLAYAWYRLLRVIGHPSAIFDPDVYLAAVKGVSRLSDEFANIEKVPRVQWEHVLGALNQAPNRDNPMFQGVQNGDADPTNDLSTTATSKTVEQPRAPPDVNTILRLLGPWLFDACLTRKPHFAAGRSEALRCLGKLLCRYSSGRSKRVNWAFSVRSLMALQNALLDDDERIAASAVYNWSKVFSLYGNHTLRGAGVVAGPFHQAIERVFRTAERKNMPSSSPTKPDGRRGGDSFFVLDDQHVGGIPIVLLRRACIEACSSLLTIHTHVPIVMIKDAEQEIVASSIADIPGLYSSLPKYTSSNVVALLMTAIKTETDPTNQQMMMWILTVAIQQEAALWASGLASSRNSQVPFTILLISSIISKSQKYQPPVLFTAFDCLRHLSLVCEEIFFHHANSVVHLVNTCCDFISNNAPVLRSRTAPFYLDSLMAAAYHCIIEWIVAAPLLLNKQQVIAKIITTIVDGNERFQSLTADTTNMAAREAAQKLVNMLMKHHCSHTSIVGSIGTHYSGLTEKFCDLKDGSDIYRHCRFFSVNKNSVLTVIEKPANAVESGEAIIIMRDSNGRYVWRSKPRYRDGPRLKNVAEFEDFHEDSDTRALSNLDCDSEANTHENSDDYDTESDEEEHVEDPLLAAIRDTHAKTPMTSWRSSPDGGAETSSASMEILPGEGNTGMSSIEKKALAGRDDTRSTQDAVFMSLLVAQRQEDKRASKPKGSARGVRCCKPTPPEKDAALQTWEVSRRMMSELGFLSVGNWGSVFAMDATAATDFLRDLETLDKLPERETLDISVAYTFAGTSRGGYDQIHLATSTDVRAGYVELSKDYQLFLSSLGEQVDGHCRKGYCGYDADSAKGRVLHYAHYSHEAYIYVPTLLVEGEENGSDSDSESDAEDTEGTNARMLFQHANVLIVWNECQQTYRPGSVLWDAVFKLPVPTSGVVLIIDPLGNDLYCVHVSHESSPLFNQRDVIANQEDSYVDEADVYTSRVLGPLLDGMVVNGAWLAPLVRQTAINASILSRSFHRYQYDIGAVSSSPVGAEANRSKVIFSFVEKYMHPKLPGEFYGDLFADLTSKS
uniref:Rap-GAP domain-containing protein n=1 Tax=Hyaloperonospora arabidopsidis (strain Emoy2) TaxID=559515 RepID=M4BH71_HYAAE